MKNTIEKIKQKKQKKFDIKNKIKSLEKNLDPSLWSPIIKINFKSFWVWFIIIFLVIIISLGILAKYLIK
ncbi:hypothetical protein J4436_03390 [Candidatus Woesearchaeota archaeon]|nr:hypothetical protein [Candidatus Woesearchaeota archaeon]